MTPETYYFFNYKMKMNLFPNMLDKVMQKAAAMGFSEDEGSSFRLKKFGEASKTTK
ncbi:hypothetical protein [Bacillus sp. Marseille-Q1617]|uniref:hypothetical protein n=1 Tax=Bacillus sp. Marseille-Q1617 TaxID=2736887 RepID=UPI00158A6F54|nr:hypothetical protein [Bacillus sp. Marseille-Q1617]